MALTEMFLISASGVIATNFGGPRDSGRHCNTDPVISQCLGENWFHNVRIEGSIDADIAEEVRWSIANYAAVTDVFMVEAEVGDNHLDVKVRAANYGANGWWASSACEYSGLPTLYGGSETPLPGTRWCKPQVIRYNLYYRAAKYPTDNNERAIACHELGHTLGLRHAKSGQGDASWTNSCMVDPAQTKTTTTQHDRDHVNARY